VFQRRREDLALDDDLSRRGGEGDLSRLAVSWLQALLRAEFTEDPGFPSPGVPAAGEDEEADGSLAVWRREWLRRWRRLQLPEQLAAFTEALETAGSAEAVHAALAEHAASVVGAYACLVFLPAGGGDRLEPLPHARLWGRACEAWLGPAAARRDGLVARRDLEGRSPYAGAAPLFDHLRAVALAVAPYAGGAAVLVERRSEREFEPLDWELLGLLCAQAEAALRRVELLGSLAVTDARTGGVGRARVAEVLRHAWAGASLGHAMTLVAVRVETPGGEAAVRGCARVLRDEAAGGGPVLRHGPRDFLLALQGDSAAAAALVERARARLEGEARLDARVWQPDPAAASTEDLLRWAGVE
jgi:hypothetical protein